MIITNDSHLDHDLTFGHLKFIKDMFGDREGFFLETVELPDALASLPCALRGLVVGDAPIRMEGPHHVNFKTRGNRTYVSRVVNLPTKQSRLLTVIGGFHEGQTILYTAFGGPATPKEVFDPTLAEDATAVSVKFWAEHALSDGTL